MQMQLYKRNLQTVQDDWIDIIKYNNTDVK
jgi:hypothetical protein